MRPAARLAAYGVGLLAALGAGAAVGQAVGPIDVGGDDHGEVHTDAPATDPSPPSTSPGAGGHDPHDASGGTGATATTAAAPSGWGADHDHLDDAEQDR